MSFSSIQDAGITCPRDASFPSMLWRYSSCVKIARFARRTINCPMNSYKDDRNRAFHPIASSFCMRHGADSTIITNGFRSSRTIGVTIQPMGIGQPTIPLCTMFARRIAFQRRYTIMGITFRECKKLLCGGNSIISNFEAALVVGRVTQALNVRDTPSASTGPSAKGRLQIAVPSCLDRAATAAPQSSNRERQGKSALGCLRNLRHVANLNHSSISVSSAKTAKSFVLSVNRDNQEAYHSVSESPNKAKTAFTFLPLHQSNSYRWPNLPKNDATLQQLRQ